MNNNTTAGNNKPTLVVNPLINKLSKVSESSENCSTYSGVFKKCLYFLVMVAAGAFLAVLFKSMGFISVDAATDELNVAKFVIISLLASLGIFLIFPFIAFFVRITIPVTGALYCMSVGYIFGFFMVLDDTLGGYILLALALTLAVVAVMGFLYSKGYIKVTKKFRAVTSTLFGAMIIGSVLIFACSFVPSLKGVISAITGNPILSLICSVTGLVIAVMFLLSDFESIRETVENRLPKKYEWFASFSLVFTVVWVYLKILQIVLEVSNKTK